MFDRINQRFRRSVARTTRGVVLLASVGGMLPVAAQLDAADESDGWRWTASAEHRLRFESITNNFRAGASNSDDLLLARTGVRAAVTRRGFGATVEMVDSRQWHAQRDTPLNAGFVNTAEVIQAHISWQSAETQLRVGRMTAEDPSRRFLARNAFRNTANFFQGADLVVNTADHRWRAFYLQPNQARPQTRPEWRDNERSTDQFGSDLAFYGIAVGNGAAETPRWEVALYGLSATVSSATQRRLQTLTALWRESPQVGAWTWNAHTALQWGSVRSAGAPGSLSHRAWFQHLLAQRKFDGSWAPVIGVGLDVASGDSSPDDRESGTFDVLYGVQRFEWGPGSLYNAFRRSNTVAPVLRLDVKRGSLSGYVALRSVWLAARKDAWAGTGNRDAGGDAGRHVGTQFDFRARWRLSPRWRFETGAALLEPGEFARRTARSGDAMTRFVYAQMTFALAGQGQYGGR